MFVAYILSCVNSILRENAIPKSTNPVSTNINQMFRGIKIMQPHLNGPADCKRRHSLK